MNDSERKTFQASLRLSMHHPGNVGAVYAMVLFCWSLHEDFGFSRGRIPKVLDTTEKIVNTVPWETLRHTWVEDFYGQVADIQLYRDFLAKIQKVIPADPTYPRILGVSPLKDKGAGKLFNDACEVAYIADLIALRRLYAFGPARVQRIQQRMKTEVWMLLEGRTMLIEYMNALHNECGMKFGALDHWKKLFGTVYGPDGMVTPA